MNEWIFYFLITVILYFLANSLIRATTTIENLILRLDKLEKRVDKHLIREIDDGK